MTFLSAALIVKDEEAALPACLERLRGFADEIVVVDTGSTDRTREVALGHGARVHAFPWVEDFAAARNESLRQCTGAWILVVDADEHLDPVSAPAFRSGLEGARGEGQLLTIRNYLPSAVAWGVHGAPTPNPGTYPGTGHLPAYLDGPALRVARNLPGLAFQGRVHESLEPCFEARGWQSDLGAGLLHHFGKASPDRWKVKQKAYFQLVKEEARAHPSDPLSHFNLMQEAAAVGEWDLCAEAAAAFLALRGSAPLKVYLDGALALRKLGRTAEALALLDRAPAHGGPAWLDARGEALAAHGRWEEAQAVWLEAIRSHPQHPAPFLHLAEQLCARGDPSTARGLLEAALDQHPKDLALWEALVAQACREGDLKGAARDAWDALQALPKGGRGLWHELVIQALLAAGDAGGAREVLRRGREAFPERLEWAALEGRLSRTTP